MEAVAELSQRVTEIEHNGGSFCKVTRERVDQQQREIKECKSTVDTVFDKIDKIEDKFFWMALALIVIALASGVNLFQAFNLIPK